jgi:anti-anti-sigma factor
MINYVKRTREQVILDDDAGHAMFSLDEYLARGRPRSVLCTPIVRQSALVGVLYMENNLVAGAFTSKRLTLLDLVATQAAISLENAQLYADLARENAERRQADEARREQLEIIEQQQEAIRALSTPIIEVWDGVLTLPLFGAIDGRRAVQIREALLDAVVRTRSRYAIVDLTGVGLVDTSTAEHILQLVGALRLLGARAIIVGIRPEVAQTIVSLGVDLSRFTVLSNLRQALVMCMRAGEKASPPAPRKKH